MTSIQILITKSAFRAKDCKLKKTVSVSAQQRTALSGHLVAKWIKVINVTDLYPGDR